MDRLDDYAEQEARLAENYERERQGFFVAYPTDKSRQKALARKMYGDHRHKLVWDSELVDRSGW